MQVNKNQKNLFALKAAPVADWPHPGRSLSFIYIKNDRDFGRDIKKLFRHEITTLPDPSDRFLFRCYLPGVSNPLTESLARVLGLQANEIRIDHALEMSVLASESDLQRMNVLWREPAIEILQCLSFSDYLGWLHESPRKGRVDNSYDPLTPEDIQLEFSPEERAALDEASRIEGRAWNRAEWELFAQTWSEHCKHKIFNAVIAVPKEGVETRSIFKSRLRRPALEIAAQKPELFLSLFHDNAGVLRIFNPEGVPTEAALAAKMETHNSPSAISPYGGASTGVVGVHRDILGTGLGALPIANWDVLCFENPEHNEERPPKALGPDIVRRGVLRGIQDGGNQSGIPTVQGSVVFDPSYAVKPLVFAGALGLLKADRVQKTPQVGDTLFCIGGATGADGLRGAVMSSRDIRSEDFSGSIVQVANPYTQRCLTDFLMEASHSKLLSAVTDNGAGGLASSVGEMAILTGGATIDLSKLRLKFDGLLDWERLLSESQERMTLATSRPEELKALLRAWRVDFDELGVLTDSGRFQVRCNDRTLVNVSLSVLHESCPQIAISTSWTFEQEKSSLANSPNNKFPDLRSFCDFLSSPLGHSREEIIRRFDHEVQGRTLRKAFGGATQESPAEGSLIEIPEVGSYVALGHGLAPRERDFALSVLLSFDEAMKRYLLATGQLRFAGLLDNFSWPDPLRHNQSAWRLELSGEILERITKIFQIPFVSGKDSMKNNDSQFRIRETLVISAFGSALGPDFMPSSFFLRPEQKIYSWSPLLKTLIRDCQSRQDLIGQIDTTLRHLHKRYTLLESWIRNRKLYSAKDASEHCDLKSLFELCLGRRIGIHLQSELTPLLEYRGHLGALHLVFDPHFDPTAENPELADQLAVIGTTLGDFVLRHGRSQDSLEVLRGAYQSRGETLWQ